MSTPTTPAPAGEPDRTGRADALPGGAAPGETAPPTRSWLRLAVAAALFLGPLLLFVRLATEVVTSGTLPYDRTIMEWVHAHETPVMTTTMTLLTELGGVVAVPVLAVLGAIVFWRAGRCRAAALLGASVIGATLINSLLKVVFQRDRPDFWEHMVVESSYSFPSGHAMASMTLASALVVIAWRSRLRWPAVGAGAVYVLAVGYSRLYLGVHYPSDVLAGWCVAVLWVAVVAVSLDGVSRRRDRTLNCSS